MSRRIEWIDTAKGIGILLVIIAHVCNIGGAFAPVSLLIYSFHMPLFFILSGYTLSKRTIELDIKTLIIKYFKTLIIPFFLWHV